MDVRPKDPDPISVEAFTAAGAPFELVEALVRGTSCRTFRNAPRSLAELYRSARVHDDKVCAVMDGTRLTYRELFAQAAAIAADLRGHGVGRGAHVAIAMRNRPEWLVGFIAISSLGAVPVLANSRSSAVELAHSLDYAQCGHVIADARCAALLAEGQLLRAQGIVVGEAPSSGAIAWRDYTAIVASGAAMDLPMTVCAPEEAALIMFTSGTTGAPKGAVLNHVGVLTALMANQLSAALLGARMAQQLGVDLATLARSAPQPCTLLVFPLFHTSGCLSVFLTTLARGGKIVFLPRWSAAEALRLVQDERVAALPAVPTMLWDILQFPDLAAFDTASLVSLGTGGQGLPANLVAAIQARFPRALLGTGYGMTETNGMVSLTVGAEFLAHPHSAGRPLATAEIRIVDEAGGALAAGEPGEICVRSAQNMSGYWEQPEADALIFRGGWLHTGDVGFIDAEGFLHVVSRKTDMIISGGENIYCAEVERVLNQHPDVMEVATFGVPDERLGEKLVAAIVPHAGARLESAQLRAFCGERLAEYKLPREWRFCSEPLERNATGKIMKAQVRLRLSGA
jgi:long-chain acyl-CoA synthetase